MTDRHESRTDLVPAARRVPGSLLRRLREWVLNAVRENFFKPRFIFTTDRDRYVRQVLPEGEWNVLTLDSGSIHELPGEQRELYVQWLAERIGRAEVASRFRDPRFRVFLAVEASTGLPVGCYWCLQADRQGIWHDKFLLPPQGTLALNAYVQSSHRRRGVLRLLQLRAQRHQFEEQGTRRWFSIVEGVNEASVSASISFGRALLCRNYLIKLFGKNLLSVYRGGGRTTIYWVSRKKGFRLL